MLDKNRHSQRQLFARHANIKRGRQSDWAHKTLCSNQWAAIAARSLFDDIVTSGDAILAAIMLTFAFETGRVCDSELRPTEIIGVGFADT